MLNVIAVCYTMFISVSIKALNFTVIPHFAHMPNVLSESITWVIKYQTHSIAPFIKSSVFLSSIAIIVELISLFFVVVIVVIYWVTLCLLLVCWAIAIICIFVNVWLIVATSYYQ